MRRVIEVEQEYKLSPEKAIDRFFKKYRELDYWKETFDYMRENNIDFMCDNTMADGTKNRYWTYALNLDFNGEYTYICIIERE